MNKTDKQESNSELIERHEVPNTPFMVIKLNNKEDTKIFGALGIHRLTEENFNSVAEAITEMQKITWNRIIQVALITQNIKLQ